MNTELELYYTNRFAMFESQGWKDLMEDVQGMLDAINTLDGITKDNLDIKKGELIQIRWLLDLEKISREAYDQLKDADLPV